MIPSVSAQQCVAMEFARLDGLTKRIQRLMFKYIQVGTIVRMIDPYHFTRYCYSLYLCILQNTTGDSHQICIRYGLCRKTYFSPSTPIGCLLLNVTLHRLSYERRLKRRNAGALDSGQRFSLEKRSCKPGKSGTLTNMNKIKTEIILSYTKILDWYFPF